MSVEDGLLQALRDTVETATTDRGGAFTTTTLPSAADELRYGQVLLLPAALRRRERTQDQRWFTLSVMLVVRSELLKESAAAPANRRQLADVRAVYDALEDEAPFAAVVSPLRSQRGDVSYFAWPSGDSSRPAGGIFAIELEWSE